MVRHVSRNDISHRPHRERIAASYPAPPPSLRRRIPQQRNCREPHAPELLYMRGPRNPIRPRARSSNILIKSRQRLRKAARKPNRPERKGPLRIAHVIQHLPDAPLLRRITPKRLLLRNPRKKSQRFLELPLGDRQNIVAAHLVDVGKVMCHRFVASRPSNYDPILPHRSRMPSLAKNAEASCHQPHLGPPLRAS